MTMAQKLQAIRGMNDLLADQLPHWQRVESVARELFADYGYREMRVPVVEHAELFQRSIGEHTDIVEKEMYSFEDRGGDRLSLRPEATAGLVRAAIEHGLLHNQRQRLWTSGPMFRHERPQQGRYRQFHQIDCEAFGYPGPDIDAEVIQVSARLWRKLGIRDLSLSVNSLGTPDARRRYRAVLVEYFSGRRAELDADSLRRLDVEPAAGSSTPRIPRCARWSRARHGLSTTSTTSRAGTSTGSSSCSLAAGSRPMWTRAWCAASTTTRALSSSGARPRSVRRMPSAREAGMMASSSCWAGSRPRRSAGPSASSAWSACLQAAGLSAAGAAPAIYLVMSGERAERAGLALAERLRDALPGAGVLANMEGGSFKAQMKRADRSGATYAVIVGDDEEARGVAAVKSLRTGAVQQEWPWDELPRRLAALLPPGEASGSNDGR